MQEITIIYPHQLFLDQPAISKNRKIFLVEHPHFFTNFQFHKQKLIYHRSTMKDYFHRIIDSGYQAEYIEYSNYENFIKKLNKTHIFIVDPIEHALQQEITKLKKQHDVTLLESPMFLTPKTFIKEHFDGQNHFSMASFYILQRKRMGILVENGKPEGGKWSFDQENRKSVPKGHLFPDLPLEKPNAIVKEAFDYIKTHFPKNPGSIDCYLPIDHEGADIWFDHFLKERLNHFGPFEDAIVPGEIFLYHSVLTPMLNIGLLIPSEIINKTLNYAQKHRIPINSLEGFIRQIIGWREFMKITYDYLGEEMRAKNFFDHHHKIPKSFWEAKTGIAPIDITIEKILKYAYCHHIERLMLLGNFMLLSKFNPKEIYDWFMELFIDAYDWVMVPNVYAMSQYADGGKMTTKPYISSSNYVLKMSHYPKGEWCDIWDALYWDFIHTNKKLFSKNPRMSMMTSLYDKMDSSKRKLFHQKANDYFNHLNRT